MMMVIIPIFCLDNENNSNVLLRDDDTDDDKDDYKDDDKDDYKDDDKDDDNNWLKSNENDSNTLLRSWK